MRQGHAEARQVGMSTLTFVERLADLLVLGEVLRAQQHYTDAALLRSRRASAPVHVELCVEASRRRE